MPRNTTMREKLDTAIRTQAGRQKETKRARTVREADITDRAKKLKTRFERRLHLAVNNEVQAPVVEEPQAKIDTAPPELVTAVETLPSPEIQTPQETEPAAETVTPDVPPDLAWLEQETPFKANLMTIVSRLKDAKSRVAFTLEQARIRVEAKKRALDIAQDEYDREAAFIDLQKDMLQKLEANIYACAMVAEQSTEVASVLSVSTGRIHKVRVLGGTSAHTPESICRRQDVLEIFLKSTASVFSAADIVAILPPEKRNQAKTSVPAILAQLAKEEKIRRVSTGKYQSY